MSVSVKVGLVVALFLSLLFFLLYTPQRAPDGAVSRNGLPDKYYAEGKAVASLSGRAEEPLHAPKVHRHNSATASRNGTAASDNSAATSGKASIENDNLLVHRETDHAGQTTVAVENPVLDPTAQARLSESQARTSRQAVRDIPVTRQEHKIPPTQFVGSYTARAAEAGEPAKVDNE
ncbi:hypothetical protein FKG94_23065 [Exilibacterium tricleocarpae]|uniref:Uncharacterized protein n=1 Tax=Exilibacterium tricleocarpae TaxID=2591008 RepID=A0A545SXI6_9GAMM|nr:hypothetical protein [Exilibacterium tricleocarpae]TQV69677.1 hypothetical protein FKG94_23065 [Exilibacterium tricleocarpae]